jgi:hypothetical protein
LDIHIERFPECLRKEFSVDKDGKVFVTRRGLARLCGVRHTNWGKGGRKYTYVIDEYLIQSGLRVDKSTTLLLIPDIEAAEVIGYYAEEQQNPIAKASSRVFRQLWTFIRELEVLAFSENLQFPYGYFPNFPLFWRSNYPNR